MASTRVSDLAQQRDGQPVRRLYVAWQDPASREISPIGALTRQEDGTYEYRYLRQAEVLPGFRPFVAFPDLHRVYRSAEFFPFFENRLVPRDRTDFSAFVAAVDLPVDADPFEILARTQGRRATDTVEVFPEPVPDPATGRVAVHFLVRGVRHVPHAQDAIDTLAAGDLLRVVPDPQNPVDCYAVLLRTNDVRIIGWIPAYLTRLVHHGLENDPGPLVTVERVGDRSGPVHLRLLCRLEVEWRDTRSVLSGPEYEMLGPAVTVTPGQRHG